MWSEVDPSGDQDKLLASKTNGNLKRPDQPTNDAKQQTKIKTRTTKNKTITIINKISFGAKDEWYLVD